MRILFIHNYYQQRGGEDTIFEQEVELLRHTPGFVVETLAFDNACFDGKLVSSFAAATRSVYNPTAARRVEQAIDAFRPDVVHIHNLFYTASPAVIRAAKGRGVPVVMTLHNYRLVCASGMLMRAGKTPCERCLTQAIPIAGIRFGCFRDSRAQTAQLTAITSLHKLTGIWRSVDKFIVLTDFARTKVLESSLGVYPEQVVTKPNFVPDMGYADPDERENFFLYVGRLSHEKGIQTLLDAAQQSPYPVEIIGDGPLRPAVEKAALTTPTIRYVGKLPRAQATERLKKCRAMLLPSVWYEGLPTTMLEAFSTGTPVICSDQKNLTGIIREGRLGHSFKTGDAQDLLRVLHEVGRQPLTATASESIYREFLNTYAAAPVLHQVTAIYASLLPRPQAVPQPVSRANALS